MRRGAFRAWLSSHGIIPKLIQIVILQHGASESCVSFLDLSVCSYRCPYSRVARVCSSTQKPTSKASLELLLSVLCLLTLVFSRRLMACEEQRDVLVLVAAQCLSGCKQRFPGCSCTTSIIRHLRNVIRNGPHHERDALIAYPSKSRSSQDVYTPCERRLCKSRRLDYAIS